MSLPVACVLGSVLVWLLAVPVRAGRVGDVFSFANAPAAHTTDGGNTSHTLAVTSHVAAYMPDTTRRSVSLDTTRRPVPVPDTTTVSDDEDKPTRKTTLLTVLAIAVLTISTLLLYNVRSR
ncbi:hypothetical protein [Hymenobacter volaticus]|uniref:Uncharacterized protein n=1 Tax=Hymenobacter volaticus TaxID=2932254 RepID=A0ABY4G696_9BACT|nr:hypothetical protein [Hymenobacter volaticus]UOQ66292.1 hypothetical protein MUN86_22865 [Hymenobacter volaticus]